MKKLLIRAEAVMFCLLFIVVNLICLDIPVYAAESATISISAPATVTVGATVKITINIKATGPINGYDLRLAYNKDVLEYTGNNGNWNGGGGMIICMAGTEESHTLEFKAIAVGSTDLAVNSDLFSVGAEDETVHNNPVAKLTVKAPVVYSGNNNLASINISNGTLSPAFNASTTSYNCNVAADVSTLVVTAKAQDGKAKVAVSGNTNLKYGRNEIAVTVTAENGAVKKYMIYCNRATPPAEQTTEAPTQAPQTVIINQIIYTININVNVTFPEGFEAVDVNYKDTIVKGCYNEALGLTLMSLSADDGSGKEDLYIYDLAKDTFTPYLSVKQSINNYVILPIDLADKIPSGYERGVQTIGGNTAEVLYDDSSYMIFYGMDGSGSRGWYRYCNDDSTVQKFVMDDESGSGTDESEPAASVSADNAKTGVWKVIAITALVFACIFLIIINVLLIQRKSDGDNLYRLDEFDDDKNDDFEDAKENEAEELPDTDKESEAVSESEDKEIDEDEKSDFEFLDLDDGSDDR